MSVLGGLTREESTVWQEDLVDIGLADVQAADDLVAGALVAAAARVVAVVGDDLRRRLPQISRRRSKALRCRGRLSRTCPIRCLR